MFLSRETCGHYQHRIYFTHSLDRPATMMNEISVRGFQRLIGKAKILRHPFDGASSYHTHFSCARRPDGIVFPANFAPKKLEKISEISTLRNTDRCMPFYAEAVDPKPPPQNVASGETDEFEVGLLTTSVGHTP